MKSLFVILIAIFLCFSNVVGQDFKIGVSESRDSLIRLIYKNTLEQPFNNVVYKLEFQLKSTSVYLENLHDIFLYNQNIIVCETSHSYNQKVNYIEYIQEEYLKQSNESNIFLEQFENKLIVALENIIDSIAKEVALENGLNAIAKKEHFPFYDTSIDYTSQIVSRSVPIVKKWNLEEMLNFTPFIEKLENDWKAVMSKDLEDFPRTIDN